MNDRLKFRYWHTKENKYIYTQCDCLAIKDTVLYSLIGKPNKGGWYETDIEKAYNDFELIPEQCTSLRDKNGNLIYEGDILQHSCSGKGVVRFGKYTGCFAAGWENIYVDLFGWYLDDYYEPDECGRLRINFDNSHIPITEEDACDFEIIGNIHEQVEQKD